MTIEVGRGDDVCLEEKGGKAGDCATERNDG